MCVNCGNLGIFILILVTCCQISWLHYLYVVNVDYLVICFFFYCSLILVLEEYRTMIQIMTSDFIISISIALFNIVN